MPKTVTCPDGAPITCAIADIADIMRNPSEFQFWSSIGIPAFAALISMLILVFSVATAISARDQAAASERARLKAEEARQEAEHEEKMRAAFSAIFASLGELSEALLSRRRENDRLVIPKDFRVLGDIAAARLAAKSPAEQRLLNRLRKFVIDSRSMPNWDMRGNALTELWRLVISWSESDQAHWDDTVYPRFDELAAMTSPAEWPEWAKHA